MRKPNKLSRATTLVEELNAKNSTGLDDLFRHTVEVILSGNLEQDNDSIRDLNASLRTEGYSVHNGILLETRIDLPTIVKAGDDNTEFNDALRRGFEQGVREKKDNMPATAAPKREVFLVHGRDMAIRESLIELLRSFDLRVLAWHEAASLAGGGTPTTADIVAAGMRDADSVVVLFTPDDIGYVRPKHELGHDGADETMPTGQARLNVVFEAGMAMAIDRSRVVLIEVGKVRAMSDTAGVNVIRLGDSPGARRALGHRLRATGLTVDMDHDEWRTAGSFPSDTTSADDVRTLPAEVDASATSLRTTVLIKQLEELKAEVVSNPAIRQSTPAHSSWKARSESVLRISLGETSNITEAFRNIKYRPGAMVLDEGYVGRQDAFFAQRVDQAAELLSAAIYELRLIEEIGGPLTVIGGD